MNNIMTAVISNIIVIINLFSIIINSISIDSISIIFISLELKSLLMLSLSLCLLLSFWLISYHYHYHILSVSLHISLSLYHRFLAPSLLKIFLIGPCFSTGQKSVYETSTINKLYLHTYTINELYLHTYTTILYSYLLEKLMIYLMNSTFRSFSHNDHITSWKRAMTEVSFTSSNLTIYIVVVIALAAVSCYTGQH